SELMEIKNQNEISFDKVYSYSPSKYFDVPISIEINYDANQFIDEGKIFIYQASEENENQKWLPIRTQVFDKNKIAKAFVNNLGLFKIGYDAEFSGSNIVPNEFFISQNYPNPFNPETNISYALPVDGDLSIRVYDILGREVEVLKNEFALAGHYNIRWNAEKFSSGVYLLYVRLGEHRDIKKMILMK
ncbi:MAG TPA: T9SS type A sorting domain-containing protein, partial [Ignavibacteriaceae bacterium]|nr:T9SS type A sorting domain-containing protein [Ignavibacteriaceae bacterium]